MVGQGQGSFKKKKKKKRKRGIHTLDRYVGKGLGICLCISLHINIYTYWSLCIAFSISSERLGGERRKGKREHGVRPPWGGLRSLIARTISFRLTYHDGPWNQRKNTNLISPHSPTKLFSLTHVHKHIHRGKKKKKKKLRERKKKRYIF